MITTDERHFYCQNWRADVSAIVTSGGAMVEWVKYSAYGIPFGLPSGDANSDGDSDSTDVSIVGGWSGISYDVRGDLNLDGVVNATDEALMAALNGGWEVLSPSGVRHRRGFAGHISLSFGENRLSARVRLSSPSLGLWLSRDPLGYVDGAHLYSMACRSPLVCTDPSGTDCITCGSGPWIAGQVPASPPGGGGGSSLRNRLKSILSHSIPGNLTGAAAIARSRTMTGTWTGGGGGDGTYQNALQHCIWACLLANAIGADAAWDEVAGHETSDPSNWSGGAVGEGTLAADPNDSTTWGNGTNMGMDLHNDMAGIRCNQNAQPCEECCADSNLVTLN